MTKTQKLTETTINESCEDSLWINYRATGDIALRNKLVIIHMDLVEIIARKMHHVFDRVAQLDDIISNGTIALIGAVENFDPGRRVKFDTYASVRIRGSVIDYIRGQDWVPRTVRDKAKKVGEVFIRLSGELGRDPACEEVSKELGISTREVEEALCEAHTYNIFSLEEMLSDSMDIDFDIEDDTGLTPHSLILRKELKQKLREAIEVLTDKERLVVTLFYYEDLKVKEISQVMDISTSRVCQIHSVALIKMKAKLTGYKNI
jgi:RNA polymerase sigma factor for flagellar operon FliA